MGKGYRGGGVIREPGRGGKGWMHREIASRGDAVGDFWATISNHGYRGGVGGSGGGNNNTSPG